MSSALPSRGTSRCDALVAVTYPPVAPDEIRPVPDRLDRVAVTQPSRAPRCRLTVLPLLVVDRCRETSGAPHPPLAHTLHVPSLVSSSSRDRSTTHRSITGVSQEQARSASHALAMTNTPDPTPSERDVLAVAAPSKRADRSEHGAIHRSAAARGGWTYTALGLALASNVNSAA